MEYKTYITLISILMALNVPIIILGFSFASITFNERLYKAEFSKYNVYGSLQNYDIEKINHDVLSYLAGRENSGLSESNFFNAREKTHFKDVKYLIGTALNSYQVSIAFFVLLFILMASAEKIQLRNILKNLLFALMWGSLLTLTLAVPFFLISNFKFDFLFGKLHSTFFHPETFTFNPESEKIVVLYPENLFFDILEKIIAKIIFSSIITVLVSLLFIEALFRPNFFQKIFRKNSTKKSINRNL